MPVAIDAHRLAEERSVAYHQIVAERLLQDSAVLDRARERIDAWVRGTTPAPRYALKWQEILQRPLPAIATFLVERSPLGDELRQSTPFAGVLSPRERWTVWGEVGERWRRSV